MGAQVLIRHTSSYWAHPLIKVKELRFQGHALHIDKIFLSKDEIIPKTLIRKKTIVFDYHTINNKYFKKFILAGVPIENKYARLEHLPNKVFWFLFGTPPVNNFELKNGLRFLYYKN